MAIYNVVKDYETPQNAGAGNGSFQIASLEDENENDVTNRIDVGVIFQDDDELEDYLSKIFNDNNVEIQE